LNHKNIINKFGANKDWDTFKKQTNLYELVFTTSSESPSIASINPFSRSFFKHWEMLHDFKEELAFPERMKCAFLAEGPGGFIEAFVKFRGAADDMLYGVTLISSNRIVPSWKFPREYLETHRLKLLYGPAGDGSLYKICNIDDFVNEIGQGQCDYVTSDGGFDFSNSFNDQEASSLMLITCEIYTAMMLQKPGGAFLLKIYDIGMDQTKQLLYILFTSYDSMTFIKPHTSRPANSEKYVLCRGFKGSLYMDKLRNVIVNGSFELDGVEFTSEFSESLAMFNVVFLVKQIVHINMTAMHKTQPKNALVHSQLQHALRWCHKYRIPINMENFHYLCLKQNDETT
jgi:23S rRNA U2552 (ribose-2'-O)-methylase RlmE/FtsJ